MLGIGGGLILLTTVAAAQPASQVTARPRPGIDVLDYDFSLTLSDTYNTIEGEATVRLKVTTDTLTAVRLDLIGKDPDEGGAAPQPGMEVTSVTENGGGVAYAHRKDILRIAPSSGFSTGQIRTFRIGYNGVPADGLIIGTNRHGDRTFFGDNWPNRARHWIPVVDHLADKATVDFRVRTPAKYEVVSNGRLVSDSTTGATRVTHWRSDVPLPPKVMVIGVADFAVDTVETIDGVPVQSWVYPEDRGPGFEDLGQAPPILRFFEQNLGPYPYEKLANVQSATRYGGMENAAAIFYSEKAVADGEDDTALIAHEIAHQWFGNTVTEADWPHLWLSEGFATYLTGLYLEHAHGPDRLATYMGEARQEVWQYHEEAPPEPLVDTTYSDANELLNTNPYQKGAWVLHMLRQEVGTDAFWEGLRGYYDTYKHKNASTADFRRVMEEVSGQDLAWFFEQWTRRAGHPVLEIAWYHDATAQECVVDVRQQQEAPSFHVPLELRPSGGEQSTTLTLRDREHRTRMDCPQVPSSIQIDPHTRLLAEWSVTQTNASGAR